MAEKLTKAEKRISARGRAQGAAAQRERDRKNDMLELLGGGAGAWGGQKWLAGASTPMFEAIPLHYTAGGLLILLSGRGRKTPAKAVLGSLGGGLILGQLGVQGYKAATPLWGAGTGG